ncbi:MAG: hypothetical protein HYY55_04405 [Candidatus Niyogibacteria bacterium]|nr:MAG: hypothetical protein HYY55_04405 [Candidatus Niyogibacteria bacterium]
MPYVPSKKTNPPADDREILDPHIEALAQRAAKRIVDNEALSEVYANIFYEVAIHLDDLFSANRMLGDGEEWKLAEAIYEVSKKYGYWGAHLGELNYSITRFIQRVPQIKVENGQWEEKNELRYWIYSATVSTLIRASHLTEHLDIAVDGVFEDIKDEYKWKVNRPYEIAQILKSGDAYDTPYYMKVIELVDEEGNVIGHQEIALKRSPETAGLDLLPWQIIVGKRNAGKKNIKKKK